MAIQVQAGQFGIDGHAKTMRIFRESHHSNSRGLVANSLGLEPDAELPDYDPEHQDNQWPRMVHSPKGELAVGDNLKGVVGTAERGKILAANRAALDAALKSGYRKEPYVKPQVPVLDAATEKANLIKQNADLMGHITMQQDLISRLDARLASLEDKEPAPVADKK